MVKAERVEKAECAYLNSTQGAKRSMSRDGNPGMSGSSVVCRSSIWFEFAERTQSAATSRRSNELCGSSSTRIAFTDSMFTRTTLQLAAAAGRHNNVLRLIVAYLLEG